MGKILITGGAGYIGSHTVHYFIKKGIKAKNVVVFDNLVYGSKKNVPKGVVFIKGDLLDKKNIERIFRKYKIDSVIHFAAYAYVGESMDNPGKYFENNILGGINLLEAMKAFNCKKIIFSSTCATYGMPQDIPITEEEKQEPINPYGESKLAFEKILKWYDKIYGIRNVVLRYFNAAGADFGIGERHDPETHLIPLVLEAAKNKNKSIKIFGTNYNTPDGTCIRDYTHVTDLADAHFKALKYLEKNNESNFFNLGTGKGVSVNEIVKIAKKITNKEIKAIKENRRSGDPAVLVASNKKAIKTLKWRPKNDINNIIKSAWAWHQKYQ